MYAQLLVNLINSYDTDNQLMTLKAALKKVDASVIFDQSKVSVQPQKSIALTYKKVGLDGKRVTYYSSNPSVATVDANGVVTGVSKGEVVITISIANGADTATTDCTVFTDYCYVTVD